MKKRKNPKGPQIAPIQNLVAKHAHLFNKAQTFCDKSKYSRKAKHPRQEASPMVPGGVIGLASCFILSRASAVFPAGLLITGR
ncbi:MAG: hypothetical protein K9L79_16110 [Methylobacter tundripaludum]|uniref:Uncharacterized protein n=2 Tax=Methylobacter tundripaludum TaxID=173365 RepID=A0A2S6H8L3_9GAMM|nr:hypothetical protein [Methylobacter tundripaludum]PPK73829.1 hypothetical protein B0F88_101361 [Methylobacter tundripaludum]